MKKDVLVLVPPEVIFRARAGTLAFLRMEMAYRKSRWMFGGCTKTLILPTGIYFPRTDARGHDRVLHVFLHAKQLFGLGHEECRLVRQEPTPDLRVGEVIALKREEAVAAGPFNLTNGYSTTSYDPALEKDAFKLVAVLAHELAGICSCHLD